LTGRLFADSPELPSPVNDYPKIFPIECPRLGGYCALMAIALTAAGSPPISFNEQDPQYRSGACNIGADEINRRWRFGHFAVISGIGLFAVLVAAGAPPLARFSVAVPAAVAAACYIEAYLKFCIRFGWLGLFNFGSYGTTSHVADAAERARDRRRSLLLSAATAAIGVAVGIVAVALPV
jgi:hypothetical protein